MTTDNKEGPGGRFWIAGGAEGDTIVFLHGFGLDVRMWTPQFTSLSGSHRLLAYDLRGFGRSTMPEGPYCHADDLAGILDSFGCERVHLVGLSMGGRVALRFALKYPARILSLTLVAASFDGLQWSEVWQTRWQTILERARGGDLPGARRLWLGHPLFDPARALPRVRRSLEAMVGRYKGWHWQNTDTAWTPTGSILKQMPKLPGPILVLLGETDLLDFQLAARSLVENLPGARRVILPACGHLANLESPDLFNEELLAHLRRAGAGS